jgi:phosphatidylinositol dimannoside acyltransferase
METANRDSCGLTNRFSVHAIFWRRVVDLAVRHLPAPLHRILIWLGAFAFFFVAAPARKNLLRTLRVVLPNSRRIGNYFRVVRIFANFGWSLTDSAVFRLLKKRFRYVLDGEGVLRELSSQEGGAIVLTAHMGNYDLGAALFAQKFERHVRMVRAPEPDAAAAQYVDLALQQAAAGVVKVGYSNDGSALAFDLLSALRQGEIISIQGDRVVGEVTRAPVKLFGREVFLPNGPFVLSLVADRPIYPLFIVRIGFRKYKIVARQPIVCTKDRQSREEQIAAAMQEWSRTLEEIVREYWPQWFAFTRVF